MMGDVYRIMVPKDIHILIPRTCDYATLHDKRDYVDVIELRILKWEDYFGLSGRAQCNHRGAYKGKSRRSREEGERLTETKDWSEMLENERRGYKPKNAGSLQTLGKARKWILP